MKKKEIPELGEEVSHILETTFRLGETEGENKILSLGEAIKRNIKSGMCIENGL